MCWTKQKNSCNVNVIILVHVYWTVGVNASASIEWCIQVSAADSFRLFLHVTNTFIALQVIFERFSGNHSSVSKNAGKNDQRQFQLCCAKEESQKKEKN